MICSFNELYIVNFRCGRSVYLKSYNRAFTDISQVVVLDMIFKVIC